MTFIIGILAGVLIAFQSAINARLRMHVGAAFLTSFVSFSVGLLFLLGLSLIMQQTPAFSLDNLGNVPLWAWTGGLLGMVGLTANVLIPQARRRTNCGHADFRPSADGRADRHFRLA